MHRPLSGTQAVRQPLDVRFPEGVHKVAIRVKGQERIIAPIGQTWDCFFLIDLIIAALSIREGLILVTNILAEFERIPALELENWVVDCLPPRWRSDRGGEATKYGDS